MYAITFMYIYVHAHYVCTVHALAIHLCCGGYLYVLSICFAIYPCVLCIHCDGYLYVAVASNMHCV